MAIVVLVCRENDTGKKTLRQSCIQKWTFLCNFGSKNNQSFCNVHNVMIQETLDIPGGEAGEGFPGATRVLVGGAMVKMSCLLHFLRISYWYQFGENVRFQSPNWYQYETRRKCCRQDIFQVADVSCLENIVSVRLGARFLNPQT